MQPSRRHTLLAVTTLTPLLSLPRAAAAQTPPLPPLQLVTGELPPLALQGGPGQRGALVDLVEALLERAEMPLQAEFFPWARAMLLAGARPRTLILPLNRTPEREASYQWLVKLYAQHFVFLTLAGRPRVQTLEQARKLRIGGLRGSSNLGKLQQEGIAPQHIYQSASISDMHRALERGVVDALYGSELIHNDAWRRSGRDATRLQSGLSLESADIWLAAQGGVTEEEAARLREHHEAMLADGSIERLFKRYGLKVRPEDLRAS